MKEIAIVGAGGLGREVAWTLDRINAASGEPLWSVVGFADDDPAKASGSFAGYPLLGSCAKVAAERPEVSFFVAVGDNATRERIVRALGERDFPAIVDPSADVAPSAVLSRGAFVGPKAVVSVAARVGAFAIVNARSGVGHDSALGDFSQVCPGASLSGATALGARALVGTNACTVPCVKVGDDATVAAGTVAFADVSAGTTLSPFGTLRK